MSDFGTFVLSQLPPPPGRVLEIGCGTAGGVVPALVDAGYDAIGVDPRAPAGERFRQVDFREIDGEYDAVVAGRVLHHVSPIGDALDRVAAFAPLLVVNEFAWDRIDDAAEDWYEGQRRMLVAAGADPPGPVSIDAWRVEHRDLHPHELLLSGLRERYRERVFEWVPYLYHWLGGPSSEALEEGLVAAQAFPAIGWRWAGVR
ncbi:MAG TPA: methyltransferase domain-containing protein [Gaiellaceae bacterium]|nr:methyltransferase domain-containing protein [Gaiellaceae bacterium]